eukprot:3400776-Prymnesium_polylepis.1
MPRVTTHRRRVCAKPLQPRPNAKHILTCGRIDAASEAAAAVVAIIAVGALKMTKGDADAHFTSMDERTADSATSEPATAAMLGNDVVQRLRHTFNGRATSCNVGAGLQEQGARKR